MQSVFLGVEVVFHSIGFLRVLFLFLLGFKFGHVDLELQLTLLMLELFIHTLAIFQSHGLSLMEQILGC